jgi:hypothetical protein
MRSSSGENSQRRGVVNERAALRSLGGKSEKDGSEWTGPGCARNATPANRVPKARAAAKAISRPKCASIAARHRCSIHVPRPPAALTDHAYGEGPPATWASGGHPSRTADPPHVAMVGRLAIERAALPVAETEDGRAADAAARSSSGTSSTRDVRSLLDSPRLDVFFIGRNQCAADLGKDRAGPGGGQTNALMRFGPE